MPALPGLPGVPLGVGPLAVLSGNRDRGGLTGADWPPGVILPGGRGGTAEGVAVTGESSRSWIRRSPVTKDRVTESVIATFPVVGDRADG